MRNTPTHLFRLRYFDDKDSWGLAFYSYAHEQYALKDPRASDATG